MTEDYSLQFYSVENFYQEILQKVNSGNSNQVPLRELKNTQTLIDQMLNHIEEAQAQGVNIDLLMQYQDKFQQLYRYYDYSAKHKVRREEFESNLARILQPGLQRPPGLQITPGVVNNMRPPDLFPQVNRAANPAPGLYIAPQVSAQIDPYSRQPSHPSLFVSQPLQPPQPPVKPMQAQMYGMNGNPIQLSQPLVPKDPTIDPWQNPIPQTISLPYSSAAIPEYSQKAVFPDGKPISIRAPPPQVANATVSIVNQSSRLDLPSGPPLPPMSAYNGPPHSLIVQPPALNISQASLDSPMAPPPRIQQRPPEIITTRLRQSQTYLQPMGAEPIPNMGQPSLPSMSPPGSDPWLNKDPWIANGPPAFTGHPSFGMPSNPMMPPPPPQLQTALQNGQPLRSASSIREAPSANNPSYYPDMKVPPLAIDNSHGDPWYNTNPWSNPPTIISPTLPPSKSKLNMGPGRYRGDNDSANRYSLSDSIIGKLGVDVGKSSTGRAEPLPPVMEPIQNAVLSDINRLGQPRPAGLPYSATKPISFVEHPSPSFPPGAPELDTSYHSNRGNAFSPNCPPPPQIVPGALGLLTTIQGQRPPSPMVLNSRIAGPPMVVAETVTRLSGAPPGQPGVIPSLVMPVPSPQVPPSIRGSGVNSLQRLSPDEYLVYRRRLDELFSLPSRYQHVTFKSYIERSISNASHKSKSPFRKRKHFESSPQNQEEISRLRTYNEELKRRLQTNSEMIGDNNKEIMRLSQVQGVVTGVVDSHGDPAVRLTPPPISLADGLDEVAAKLFHASQDPHVNPEMNQLSKMLFDRATTEMPKLPTGDPTNIEKYIISNEMLQKENNEIRRKINELEDVMEELARYNMQLKYMDRSGHRSANTYKGGPARSPDDDANPELDRRMVEMKESSSDSLIKSLGGGDDKSFPQPKIRPVEYVHTDGGMGAFPSVGVSAQPMIPHEITLPQMFRPALASPVVQTTSMQSIPLGVPSGVPPGVPPVVPPVQLANALRNQSAQATPIKPSDFVIGSPGVMQAPSPVIQTAQPPLIAGLSSIPRLESSQNIYIPGSAQPQPFLSMHNTYVQDNSLWINDRSMMYQNEEERMRFHNRYVLPPTTNDLNKVNARYPDYEIHKSAAFGGTPQGNYHSFSQMNPQQRSINSSVMPPSAQLIPQAIYPPNTPPTQTFLNSNNKASQPQPPQQLLPVTQSSSLPPAHHNYVISSFSSRTQIPRRQPVNPKEDPTERSFDTFKVADSVPDFSNSLNKIYHDSVQSPPALEHTSSSLLTRNKVAFFKKSLVLLKNDPKFEIAFKRSDLNDGTVRVIFYVNNKTSKDENINIEYEFDQSMYQLRVGEKLVTLHAGKQGREELTVSLRDDSRRPLSFIICHFTIGATVYDILLPVLFFSFAEGLTKTADYTHKTLTIIPNKQFASPHFMYTLMPLTYINDEYEVEYLKGEKPYKTEITVVSRKNRSALRMDWFQGLLKINGDERWVDMVAWLLADIRL